jgi:hypothetical protein
MVDEGIFDQLEGMEKHDPSVQVSQSGTLVVLPELLP